MNANKKKPGVAVILGGDSNEREVSLKSGRAVAKALDPGLYRVMVFDPSLDLARIIKCAAKIDCALIMLHGRGGEDGTMQGFLDLLGIPYQCSGVLGCALAMNKPLAKERYRAAGLPVAPDLVATDSNPRTREEILDTLGLPVVVKPSQEGSSYGVTVVRYKKYLYPALKKALAMDQTVLVEKFLSGTEVTASVLINYKEQVLPLVEIIPGEKYIFFDYHAKYQPGATQEICPARLDPDTTSQVQQLALKAHHALYLDGYSRSDFIVTPDGPFILETNTIPGMTETSLLPLAASGAGLSFTGLINRLVDLALAKQK